MKTTGFLFVCLLAVILTATLVTARPAKSTSLSRQKRQSDQRLAELETLLALQKYGRHRFRTDRKKGVGAEGEHPPGYGIIDFRMLGRKKKSTRFSPGELESPINEEEDIAQNRPKIYRQEEKHRQHHHHQQQRLDAFEVPLSEESGSIYPDQVVTSSERESRPSLKKDTFPEKDDDNGEPVVEIINYDFVTLEQF